MVEKFYAYYKGKKINVYEGLRLKRERKITTSPVSKAELFDSPNYSDQYPLSPKLDRCQ